MKRIILAFGLILACLTVNAQAPTMTPAQERAHTQTIRLQKRLALSEQQVTQVEAILVARNTEIDAVNADQSKSEVQKKADIETIRTAKEVELRAVMTSDQYTQYLQMKDDFKKRKEAKNGQQ